MFIKRFSKWEECSIQNYRHYYHLYGGDVSSHPDILDFQHNHLGINHKYLVKVDSQGNPGAAICVWNDKFLANDSSTSSLTTAAPLPISTNELIVPIKDNFKTIIPFKSKIISSLKKSSVSNSTFRYNAKRKICIAKTIPEFSTKTRQTRNRELRKFLADGGRIEAINSYSPDDIVDMYSELFKKRRGVVSKNDGLLKNMIETLPGNFFGSVLFLKNEACALQLITKAESQSLIYYDYINIGFDMSIKNHCLGTIITWVNVNEAYEECLEKNKRMRFSFGKPTFDYKARWCNQESLGRVLTI
jgi:hypothetical protein